MPNVQAPWKEIMPYQIKKDIYKEKLTRLGLLFEFGKVLHSL